MNRTGLLALILACCSYAAAADEAYSWQKPHAKVIETGDLEWTPEPFKLKVGKTVRYIDFENGNDSNDGSKSSPWKHHPWDPAAKEKARGHRGSTTYIFKRGVIYRGVLRPKESGTADDPIRLTSDPNWGRGEAMFYGSDIVTGFSKGAHAKVPDGGKVWKADLNFAPRGVFITKKGGSIERLKLARTPNWTVTDPDDVAGNWWAWKRWKKSRGKHLLMDPEHITEDPDYYLGGLVWSEWAIMMGTPYAAQIEGVDKKSGGLLFQGPWHRDTQRFFPNNRYYIEDKPHYLDEAGEYWFDKAGKADKGTLYLRMPDDSDPNRATIEATNRISLIEAKEIRHVEISGISFRFDNVHYDLTKQRWMHPDVDTAIIRLLGKVEHVAIRNCRFEHVKKAIRLDSIDGNGYVRDITISDNVIDHTDHGAIIITDKNGVMTDINILRNNMRYTGIRPMRPNGHNAIGISRMITGEIAGNVLDTCYGAGIFIFGGKNSGETYDVPLVRILIHHNRITNAVLNTNDWGNIETWQSGPIYVYNNVAGNPVGPFNWTGGRFAHAYYLDGGFKNYHFNNIAWGKESDPKKKRKANVSAFQEIHSYQNTFFNNTAYRFRIGSRRQTAEPGRDKFLGNIFQDIGEKVFRHSDSKNTDPNAHHAGAQGDHFEYATNAYSKNVFYNIGGIIGNFEALGGDYPKLADFAKAMKVVKPLADDVGVMSDKAPLRNAERHDFRPTPGSAAIDNGVRAFVPWALYGMVGEWNFTRHKVPTHILDEHWYLTNYHIGREDFESRPMYPLKGQNISAGDYDNGVLEDWAPGVLRLNGTNKYLSLSHSEISKPFTYSAKIKIKRKKVKKNFTVQGPDLKNMDIHNGNFLIEAFLQLHNNDTGVLVRKSDGKTGYELSVVSGGKVQLEVLQGGNRAARVSTVSIADGKWHHVIAEVDRKQKSIALYINGKVANSAQDGQVPASSLSNNGDFLVGGGPGLNGLSCSLDFLRFARGTLADAKTDIAELFAWQFRGPHYRDFTGREPTGKRDAGAIEQNR